MEQPERRGGDGDFKAPLDASLLFTFLALGNAPRAFAACVSAWRTPTRVTRVGSARSAAITGRRDWRASGRPGVVRGQGPLKMCPFRFCVCPSLAL
jgi:hypothetical protein